MTEFNESIERPGTSGQAEDSEQGVRLRIIEILGLYRPGFSDRRQRADRRPIRCGYQPGYISSDDRGRIFINHRPRRNATENWQRARINDTQYIEVIVEVVDPSGIVPGNAKIRWAFGMGTDRTLEHMHRAAADAVQDAAADTPRGRFGTCDFLQDGERKDHPVFEALDRYPGARNQAQMDTDIVSGRSGVCMHGTNVGGNVYWLQATLVNGPSPAPRVRTGEMTMWKRIDVEYHRMNGVPEIRVDRVARAFEMACIQLDFTDSISMDHEPTICDDDNIEEAGARLCQRHFHHARRPGWFMLVAADLETSMESTNPPRRVYPTDLRTSAPAELHSERVAGTSGACPILALPHPLPPGHEASTVTLYNGQRELVFYAGDTVNDVRPGRPGAAIEVGPIRYHPDPQPGDGSKRFAIARPWDYFPIPHNGVWGLGFPSQVQCVVETGRAIGAAGVTPVYDHEGTEYFGGRSIVFMGKFRDFDEEVAASYAVRTAIHELCHAFGFPHACGRRQARAGARRGCVMTILDNWSFRDGSDELGSWNHLPRGEDLCERHLLALRRVQLEENPYLWRWW